MYRLWKITLSLTGIFGVGLLVLILVYTGILKLPIFSPLSQDQSFMVLMALLVLIFLGVIATYFFRHKELKIKNDAPEELMLYQWAFLWHGVTPPGISEHFPTMTAEIESTKRMLHDAVDIGLLRTSRETRLADGSVTRWITKRELTRYAKSIKVNPDFLK